MKNLKLSCRGTLEAICPKGGAYSQVGFLLALKYFCVQTKYWSPIIRLSVADKSHNDSVLLDVFLQWREAPNQWVFPGWLQLGFRYTCDARRCKMALQFPSLWLTSGHTCSLALSTSLSFSWTITLENLQLYIFVSWLFWDINIFSASCQFYTPRISFSWTQKGFLWNTVINPDSALCQSFCEWTGAKLW